MSSDQRLAVFSGGLLDDMHAKTTHGILRFGAREVVCVVDDRFAGRRADEVMPFCMRPSPIVATVDEARALGATRLVIGVAPSGGKITDAWKQAILHAIELGMDVEAGLHTELGADRDIASAAARHGVEVTDLRAAPPNLNVPRGPAQRAPGYVVHTVGSDCAIGKMTVVCELDRAARTRGERSVLVATGQTGIAITGWGIAVDHVISDYIAGAAEQLVDEGARRGDLILVEGQGSLLHPAYSGVTLGLLHGSAPDALLLAHEVGSPAIDGYPEVPFPSLPAIVALYEGALAAVRPAPVIALALNTRLVPDDDDARRAIEAASAETGLPAFDAVRFGVEPLLDVVLAARPA